MCDKENIEKTVKKRTVLFVDDNEIDLRSLERGLLDESYSKLFARSGKEALEIMQQEEVHVIVTDMCMPEMTGLELLRSVRKERPEVIGIVLSGYEEDAELHRAVQYNEIFKLVSKPWNFGEVDFEKLVRRAVNQNSLQNEQDIVNQQDLSCEKPKSESTSGYPTS